jgi:hypothetical protein
VRLLAEAPCEQVIDMLGDVAAPAVADPDERGKLAYLLAWLLVCADERGEQFHGALRLFLAEPADEQLQPLPRCHASSLTASAVTCRVLQSSGCWLRWQQVSPLPPEQGCRRSPAWSPGEPRAGAPTSPQGPRPVDLTERNHWPHGDGARSADMHGYWIGFAYSDERTDCGIMCGVRDTCQLLSLVLRWERG